MNISIIIPNFNGERLLKENLPKVLLAVKDYKKGKIEIIIADDTSIDNSVEIIEKFIYSIKVNDINGKLVKSNNPKERGFSTNVNRAINVSTGDIIILLNTDVIPYKDFLGPLLKHFSNQKVFAVGCLDESMENGKVILRGRGIGKWSKGFLFHSAGKLDKTSTLWVSGGSGAFRKTIWDKLGGLQELYNPYYWEDIDISYRAQKAGYTLIFEKESKVIHEHERGSIKIETKSENIQKISYRNQFIFVWLNITDKNLIISHILWLPYHILNSIKEGNFNFVKGLLLALKLLPKILIYRKKIRIIFTNKDSKILSNFKV